jgi:hypothetical protein
LARGDDFLDVVVDSDDGSGPEEKLREVIEVPHVEVGVPTRPQAGADMLLESVSV